MKPATSKTNMNTKHLIFGVLFACGIFIAGLQSSNADTATESFEYTPGSSLFGQTGGTGWTTNAWTVDSSTGGSTITMEAGSMTYPGIAETGGKMRFTGAGTAGTTTTTYRELANPLTNGTAYVSCLAQNLNDAVRYFGVGLFNGSSEQMLLGAGSGFPNWTINRVLYTNGVIGVTNTLVSTVDTSEPALLVLKLEFDAGNTNGFERVTFWVNPDLSQPESLATAVNGTNYITDRDFGQITRIRLGGGGNSTTYGIPTDHNLDELVISSVTPFALPAISQSVSGGNVSLLWPVENLGWNIQQTTNLVSGTWLDVPDSDMTTSTNLPINPANPTEFFRLRCP